MDIEDRRLVSKATKKGGKQAKLQNAEEEARRREAIRETLRERLELEKKALQVVERLLEDRVSDDFLLDCARFITAANYKDAVEERFITKLCGYPLCSNKLGKIPKQQYKISTKTNRVYDITERKSFCSNFCYKASKEFELQISKTPLWLRHGERPPEIKLKNKGDVGSSGEQVHLTVKCLQVDDIEQPLNIQPADHQERSPATGYSDTSDDEREQDFISSVLSQDQRPRVHWGDRPKRKNEGDGLKRCRPTQKAEKKSSEQDHEGVGVEELTKRLNLCGLQTAKAPQEEFPKPPSPCPSVEPTRPSESSSRQDGDPAKLNSNGLNVIQVGMSKQGASGLRELLKNHVSETKPNLIGQNLLKSLRTTLNQWLTSESLRFLQFSDSPSPFMKNEEEVEELDEDDLEDEVVEENANEEEDRRAPPDYETLKKDTQQMALRVREFYKGTWILPEEQQNMKVDQDQSSSECPTLPLVDSKAQHLIQKRIAVEKLASCLKNVVGPLSLTLSDITSDLNNLVRTFRFTNTNIIHKPPEWTLIAVVILHLLSSVSPVVAEALATPSSMSYVNTLMEELGLHKQDLLNLLQSFKNLQH
ncbi:putative RNA polymerase II subunit B1 CTD phosphatase rpap2 [Stigmatopora nigra]